MTMDRYGHLFPSEDHKRAMDEIAVELFMHPWVFQGRFEVRLSA